MPAPEHPLNVLLIEDNDDHSALIEGYLRGVVGVTVERTDQLSTGLESLASSSYQALLLDLHLPDSRGLETLEKVVAEHAELPVIVLTTLDDEDTAVKALQQGAQDYLAKDGVTGEILRRAIRRACERKQIERALQSTEEQLRHSQKMEALGRVAGGVAHDFNNLLTIINGYSEELLGRVQNDARSTRQVQNIRKAGERAKKLTEQLLAFTRMQVLELTELDLKQVVAETAPLLRPLIGRQIELRIDEGSENLYVRADADQLSQVILNLAVNARDAMPGGGTLTIETEFIASDQNELTALRAESSGYAMLRVTDTGTGMDEETASKIFEPFFTTKMGKGTGLGLSTVYGIVVQSGGEITVSTAEGDGTSFTILLPRVATPVQQQTETTEHVWPTAQGTVLVVDDEEAICELLGSALMRQGYTVLEAPGPQAALDLCQSYEGEIDLLVTDVVMPHTSGFQLSKQITALRPATKTLYMSGYVDRKPADFARAKATNPCLQKPLSIEGFLSTVRELLSERQPVEQR